MRTEKRKQFKPTAIVHKLNYVLNLYQVYNVDYLHLKVFNFLIKLFVNWDLKQAISKRVRSKHHH